MVEETILPPVEETPADKKQAEAKKVQAGLVEGAKFPGFEEKDLAGAEVFQLPARTLLPQPAPFQGAVVLEGVLSLELALTSAGWVPMAPAAGEWLNPPESDFERNIRRFSDFLVRIIFLLTVFVFLANALLGKGWFEVEMAKSAEALHNGDGLSFFDAEQELVGLRINTAEKVGKAWRCTTKPGKLYFTLFTWPSGSFQLPPMKAKATKAWLLAAAKSPLRLITSDGKTTVRLPENAPDNIASVIAVEMTSRPFRLDGITTLLVMAQETTGHVRDRRRVAPRAGA